MFKIEKDKTLNTYIVWEIHHNCLVESFRGTKKECEKYLKNKKVIDK